MSALNDWINEWGTAVGVGALITFMIFIMWDLAKKTNAGKFGTIIIFIGLGLGILGFLIKVAIQYGMESAGV
ncbi:DUF2788 domain-containing protein [Agaribacterium haliotis]|uniref:DUF2788 domain-containing protein n=1 Tax=Agaribacterium haliotis TaxID=2013869 RepID=UPI001EFC805A|nr:DUF2788 domain-containing protein [Agaribacterium haliotis]